MKKTVLFLLILVTCLSVFTGCAGFKNKNAKSAFYDDCGVSVSATLSKDILNYAELNISVKNTADKEIAAVKLYAIPQNVYGDEIDSWFAPREILYDTAIPAEGCGCFTHSFLDESVKTVTLYVYSVYFSDGTEWGDRNAKKATILKEAREVNVKVD